jgi:hypothetical protein
MPKPNVIAKWTEMSQMFLQDGPPKRQDYEAGLFLNRCEVRQTTKGTVLYRSVAMEFLYAPTADELAEKVRLFILHDDLRMLAKGIDANDFATLPQEQKNPPKAIVEGTDEVYADKYAIGAT